MRRVRLYREGERRRGGLWIEAEGISLLFLVKVCLFVRLGWWGAREPCLKPFPFTVSYFEEGNVFEQTVVSCFVYTVHPKARQAVPGFPAEDTQHCLRGV